MTKRLFIVAAAAAVLAVPAFADYTQTTGTASYNSAANWDAGNINGVFSRTLSGNAVVTFNSDTVLTTGLTFTSNMPAATSYAFRGDVAPRTITLGGNISVNVTGPTVRSIGLGGSGATTLDINPGGNRTFSVARAGDLLTISNSLVGGSGDITKAGAGTLILSSTTAVHNVGDFYVNEGIFRARTLVGPAGPSGRKVYLGDTSGTASAFLETNNTFLDNDVVVRSGSTGNKTFRPGSANDVGINGSLTLQGNLIVDSRAAGSVDKDVILSGAISGTGTLTKINARPDNFTESTLVLSGAASNTNVGLVTLADGALVLSKTGGATAVAGNLVVGDGDFVVGTGANIGQNFFDELRFAGSDQIAETSDVIVNNTAFVNLSTFSDTIDSLTLNLGSQVRTDAVAGGTLFMNALTIDGVSFGTGVYTAASGIISGINFATYITGTGSLVVPEPSALGLLAVAGVGMLRRRK